jgi:hypothetical protein
MKDHTDLEVYGTDRCFDPAPRPVYAAVAAAVQDERVNRTMLPADHGPHRSPAGAPDTVRRPLF